MTKNTVLFKGTQTIVHELISDIVKIIAHQSEEKYFDFVHEFIE